MRERFLKKQQKYNSDKQHNLQNNSKIIQQSGQKKAKQKKQRKYNAYKFNMEKQNEQINQTHVWNENND